MPELPEVENIACQLRKFLPGLEIAAVDLRTPSILKSGKTGDLKKFFGKKIRAVERRGKFLIFRVEPAASFYVHLGMTGQLLWDFKAGEKEKHVHAVFAFRGTEKKLAYRDIRRFGGIALVSGDPATWPGVRLLGPEPFEIGEADFLKRFSKRQARIKSLLLNQKLLAGVGNIYADEALFRAGIDPRKRSCSLKREKFLALRLSIIEVLKEAIEAGGSSIDDYVHVNGGRGGFQARHRVYARAGKKCVHCDVLIKRVVLGGRSSFFCPNCQK